MNETDMEEVYTRDEEIIIRLFRFIKDYKKEIACLIIGFIIGVII